ncbi:hypothetical protein EDB19DRAFT_2039066 [Suillus lakei]|nr:hypothetical protein EDB19DRAFT_2039066 [Suillus lakei]
MDLVHSLSYGHAWSSLCDVVEYGGIFDSEKRQPHSRCMHNTRVALRENLRQVLDQPDRTNVWLNGLAGVGKTAIAFSVAEEMKAAERLAATFFFSREHTQSPAAVIPTIAYQLALAFPRIRDNIEQAIERDKLLLSSEKSCSDQMRELVAKPLQTLKFRQETPYAIIIDALDECLFPEEAARLVMLFTETLAGPDLPNIHIIFTSRPEVYIHAAMPPDVYEILLTTRDKDTTQDVRFFLRASLDKIRTSRPLIFGQPPTPLGQVGGLHSHPKQTLGTLLRKKSALEYAIDPLYRQIIAKSGDPVARCQMLASVIHLRRPLPLAELQDLFHADQESLVMMLEAFSSVILNPSDGVGNVEIYHASLGDFMVDPLRSMKYHVNDTLAHEHLARSCLNLFIREELGPNDTLLTSTDESSKSSYPFDNWAHHLSMSYPSDELRNLLALFTEKTLRRWMTHSEDRQMLALLNEHLREARKTCLSHKWIRSWSDIVVAWRIDQAFRKTVKYSRKPEREDTSDGQRAVIHISLLLFSIAILFLYNIV